MVAAVIVAVIAAVAILGAICWAFSGWLDAAPGRRKRFWRASWVLLALTIGALWWATSRTTLLVAVAWGALVGVAVGILRIKDRWPAVGVALAWLTWWGWLLGLLAVVLHATGWLP